MAGDARDVRKGDSEDALDQEDEDVDALADEGGHRSRKQRSKDKQKSASSKSRGDEHLPQHRRPKEKTDEIKQMLLKSIKQDRFCGYLQNTSIESMLESMEYFVFSAGEVIVKQGNPGRYFFIVHEGSCNINVKGVDTATIGSGASFGAIALLYNCPRTATVSAEGKVGVWGADGDCFRTVLQESSRQHYEENLRFLDYVSWFVGLTTHQKERICKLALSIEAYGSSTTIIRQGDPPTAIYIVKKGEVSISIDGKRVSKMRAGDTIGERAVLYGTAASATVTTEGPCEFVCLGVRQMKEALGENLSALLEGPLLHSVLKNMAFVSHFSLAQLYQIVEAMDIASYKPGVGLPEGQQLLVVINGEMSGDIEGKQLTIRRGQSVQDESMAQLYSESQGTHSAGFHHLVAGSEGARVATLSKDAFARVLGEMGFLRMNSKEATGDALRKKLISTEVPILRNLAPDKVDLLMDRMTLHKYSRGAQVIKQGEFGSSCFIVKSGEIQILRDGIGIRTLGPNASFGERALLMDEARSATVEVISDVAHLWSIDKGTFDDVLSESMRDLISQRLKLQDTTVKLRSLIHLKLVGVGSFGSVRMVQHRYTNLRYALKRVRKEDGAIPEAVRREVDLLHVVDHPFILTVVRMFETRSSVYILTELITGGQLYDQLGRMGILTRKQAQFYAGTLVIALEALHTMKIVYRDLKPENVLLDSMGYLKLIDFGLAKKLDKALPVTYTVVGTPAYMAPEVVRGNGHGFEVDIWALGVMIFEFVVGYLPFGHDGDIQDVIASVLEDPLTFPPKYNDAAGKRLLNGMLNKDPQRRLGAGVDGWQVIKTHKYFKQGIQGDLFSKIISHELPPPAVPETEYYGDEQSYEEEVTLSDAHELHVDD